MAERMGKQVRVVSEADVTERDLEGVDLVVSMGGDKCFLKAQSILENGRIPILGINSNPARYFGALNNHTIDFDTRNEQAEAILETIEDEHNVEFERRTRLVFQRNNPLAAEEGKKVFVLNEAFIAERDGTSMSRYRLGADGRDLGVFKSSGLIVSTGTGSTGWLYASR